MYIQIYTYTYTKTLKKIGFLVLNSSCVFQVAYTRKVAPCPIPMFPSLSFIHSWVAKKKISRTIWLFPTLTHPYRSMNPVFFFFTPCCLPMNITSSLRTMTLFLHDDFGYIIFTLYYGFHMKDHYSSARYQFYAAHSRIFLWPFFWQTVTRSIRFFFISLGDRLKLDGENR